MVVNLAVLITISLILNLLGISPYLRDQYGIDYSGLMVFCLVWGMGGSLISLMISKYMAKLAYRIRILDPRTSTGAEGELVAMVTRLSQAARLPKVPEVGVYESQEVNAFATGPSKSNSLVAVSTGLLSRMDKAEVEGVLGHEVAHIANGDMVTMTLLQGVVNAFVMFMARIAAFAVQNMMRSDDREGGPSYLVQFGLIMAFEVVFGMLGMIVVAWFSRLREFRADAGGATLAGRQKMIAALTALKTVTSKVDDRAPALAAFKISGSEKFLAFFSTHPPLEVRIARLRQGS